MEENHRVAFPEVKANKKKKSGEREKSQAEKAAEESNLSWIFTVVLVLGFIFAGFSAYLKSGRIPEEDLRPVHLRTQEVATPTPPRVVRGYSLTY